jgi:hypothetical protein
MIEDLARARMLQQCVGLVNRHPAWKLDTNALADMLNVRVYDDEIETTNGRSKENATAIQSTPTVQAMEYGVDSGGTERLIVAADTFFEADFGVYWYINGDTKTLISKAPQTGETACEVTTQAVSGTGTNWTQDVAVGDYFYMENDGPSAAQHIVSVVSDTSLSLSAAYAGSTTAGSYVIADKQNPTNKPVIRQWMNKFFFVNGKNKPMQWDPTADEFREVGFPTSDAVTSVSGADSGNLSADKWYGYKICRESNVGGYIRFGNASVQTALDVGANGSTTATDFPSFKAYQTHWRIYRTLGQDAESDVSAAQFFHLTSVPVSSVSAADWWDTTADSVIINTLANINDIAPFENDQPPVSASSMLVHKDRALWTVGTKLAIGGLTPYDYHSDANGRWEPEYAPAASIRYIGRDTRDLPGCQGVFEQSGQAYFLRSRTIYRLRSESDDPTVWQVTNYRDDVGGEAFFSVAQDGIYTYWLGRLGTRLGILRFNGAIIDNIGAIIQGSVDDFTTSTLSAAQGLCSEGYYYLSVNAGAGDKTFEWNSDRGDKQGSWSEKDWFAESFCRGVTKGYAGDDSGFVYQLEQGLDEAGAAITRRIATGAMRFRSQDPLADRYWKVPRDLWVEVYTVSGFAALSGWYKSNEGSWSPLTGYPISGSAGATVYKRVLVPTAPNNRGTEFKFESSGTAEDWTFRDMWITGRIKPSHDLDGTET